MAKDCCDQAKRKVPQLQKKINCTRASPACAIHCTLHRMKFVIVTHTERCQCYVMRLFSNFACGAKYL